MSDPDPFTPRWQVVRISTGGVHALETADTAEEARRLADTHHAAVVVFRSTRPVPRPPWEV
ncbi:hypothetical protein HNP73_000265 [Amaricoccus macauensis]|uniref:Uncharacterized protein n=1 Tax=Amaricoccus macauensis TaxID=57001 RepID=A0A840SHD9_9RHOB|nr:hypothetical protein [Amaricoccus macauensis]MBB5220344.1 hypothetical protein [Amaricoccus macauensis]